MARCYRRIVDINAIRPRSPTACPPSPRPSGSSSHADAPAVLIVRDGTDFALLTIGGSQREIDRILWVMNPVSLGSIALVAHTAHEPSTRDACS
jgi:hypothetical protein